jgi:tetratricopeptide (TPR) repeat protein
MYLQQVGETEKFQPSLLDYFAPVRSQVRGESPLGKAIRCYQYALVINPIAKGTKANLAMALAATREKENLTKAEGLLKELLSAEPSNPSYLNDYAILTYWQQDVNATDKANQDKVRNLFQKAADAGSLSGVYNLAMLQIDNGESEKGVKGLAQYLKRDSFSPWAKRGFALLQQRNIPTGNLATPSRPSVTNILGVKLGATPDEVAKVIEKPDRVETGKTSVQDSGLIFWYTTLGMGVVFSEDKAVLLSVFAPSAGDQFRQSDYAPQPEVAGVAIGHSFDDLRKTLGEPVSVRTDSKTGDNIYGYPCGEAILWFWARSSIVYGITFTKAVPA